MPGQAAKVTITEKQQEILVQLSKSRSASVSHVQRAKIILLAFEGHNNEAIEQIVDLHHDAVGVWRRRWRDNWRRLIDVECNEEPHVLKKEILTLLSDRKRSGRPRQITEEQQAAIFTSACETPSKKGRPSATGVAANCSVT